MASRCAWVRPSVWETGSDRNQCLKEIMTKMACGTFYGADYALNNRHLADCVRSFKAGDARSGQTRVAQQL